MEKILAVIYLSVIFFYAILYLVHQTRDYVYRHRVWKKARREIKSEKLSEPVIDVVGKTTTVFLTPLKHTGNKPFMSDNLEMETAAETEPQILPEEVEAKLNHPVILGEDELDDYSGEVTDLEGSLSQGLTYQQISDAIDVVEGRKSGETEEYLAGEIFSVMPDDFLTMICMQTEHEFMVKRLIACYVDSAGKMKPAPALIENFDISKYI